MVEKIEDKIPDKKSKPLKLQEKLRKDIGEGIIKSMEGFVTAFTKRTETLNNDLAMNLNKQRLDLRKVFKEKIDDVDLLPNLLEFKDYLEQSGESIAQFGKNAKMTDQQIKSLEESISALDKTTKEMDQKERNLKKAGLVVERKIVAGKLKLKVLNGKEIRQKQQEIINKRKEIEENERYINRLSRQTDEHGRVNEETQEKIEKTTELIEELNQEILDLKDKGVKEVKKVMTGFAGAVMETYSRFKTTAYEFMDAFLPGPVATVFKSMIHTVETVVSQFMDLIKPITATIGLMIAAPRFIAKKLFGKTDEEFDEMRANFIKKTKKFLLESATMAKEKVKDAAMYIGGKFLKAIRFVGKVFTTIGLAVKGIMLALLPFKKIILVIVGILALVGIAIFMFGKKIYEVGEKLAGWFKDIFEKIKEKLDPILEPVIGAFNKIKNAIMSIVNYFKEKLGWTGLFKEDGEKKEVDKTTTSKEGMDKQNKSYGETKPKYTQEEIEAKIASGEWGKIHSRWGEHTTDEGELRSGLIDTIMNEGGGDKKNMSQRELEKMSNAELYDTAKNLLEDSPLGDFILQSKHGYFAQEVLQDRSQKKEDEFMKRSKIMVDGQERSMYDLAYDNTEKGLQLKARLQNNKEYKQFMKTKAEYDARQQEMGAMTNQQAINNLTSSQNVSVNNELPTRNLFNSYTDYNAMVGAPG